MSSELTVVQTAPQGGVGISLDSKFFQLKPGTIQINQPNSQAEGAIKGKLRLSESGDQYDSLNLVIIAEPSERADYYVGEPGTLFRVEENRMCFSRDMKRPDVTARAPQAVLCASCGKNNSVNANWEKYRETKNKADIPGCDRTLRVLFLDTKFRIPLQMYLRSAALKAFETGLQEFTRKLHIMKSQGLNPNIFDVAFTMSTKPSVTGKITNYVPFLSAFRTVSPEEQADYFAAHLLYTQQTPLSLEAESAHQIDQTSQTIDTLTSNAIAPAVLEGEIVI